MHEKIRVIFMSGTKIGCRYIEAVLSSEQTELKLVVTGPDRPRGRGRKIEKPETAKFCGRRGINVFQPENINSHVSAISNLKPHLILVVDYGQILSKQILDIPQTGAFNIHYSLLPDLRGADPVRHALLKGYKKTGVTLIKMNEKIDQGEIVLKSKVTVENEDNYKTLINKLTAEGVKLVKELLEKIKNNEELNYEKQDPEKATSAPKVPKDMQKIDWNMRACDVLNRIRAFSPVPGAFTFMNSRKIIVTRARVKDSAAETPGKVVEATKNSFTVSAADGGIEVLELKPAGKREMSAKAFLAGNPVKKGDLFE